MALIPPGITIIQRDKEDLVTCPAKQTTEVKIIRKAPGWKPAIMRLSNTSRRNLSLRSRAAALQEHRRLLAKPAAAAGHRPGESPGGQRAKELQFLLPVCRSKLPAPDYSQQFHTLLHF